MRKLVFVVCIFLWAVIGHAATAKVIYTLEGANGKFPSGPPTLYKGSFYGTTLYGTKGLGSVYRLYPTRTGGYAFVSLHEFNGSTDGELPAGNLCVDGNGNLFGIAAQGGANGFGTVWELVRPANLGEAWTFQVLWNFAGASDGRFPIGGVAFNGGAVYGVTEDSAYRLAPDQSGNYQFQVIGAPLPPAGALPTFDAAGNVYVINVGSISVGNSIYEMSQDSQGNWMSVNVAPISSTSSGDPASPIGGILRDPSGSFYGISAAGGAYSGGTIYKVYLDPTSTWATKVLRSFNPGSETYQPMFSLLNVKKRYYGVLYSGPDEIFQAYPSPTNRQWMVNHLLDTQNSAFGHDYSAISSDGSGNLYGTSGSGGDTTQCNGNGCGVLWEITP